MQAILYFRLGVWGEGWSSPTFLHFEGESYYFLHHGCCAFLIDSSCAEDSQIFPCSSFPLHSAVLFEIIRRLRVHRMAPLLTHEQEIKHTRACCQRKTINNQVVRCEADLL